MTQPVALTFSLTNILKFMSYLSPLLITFSMIMYSILTNNVAKGLIFMTGLVIITFINYLLKNSVKSPQSELASPFCNTLPAPFTYRSENSIFNSPSTSSTIIAFAASFLIYPMVINKTIFNTPLMVFLITMIGINGAVEYSDLCTPLFGILLGVLTGVFFGILYYTLISLSNPKLAFFAQTDSNNIQCSKPGKRQFKCSVKNKTPEEEPTAQSNFTLTDDEKELYPICKMDGNSVWGKCDVNNKSIKVFKWGISGELIDDITECSSQIANPQNDFPTCGDLYDQIQEFQKGEDINLLSHKYRNVLINPSAIGAGK